jgi:hypothetical protein
MYCLHLQGKTSKEQAESTDIPEDTVLAGSLSSYDMNQYRHTRDLLQHTGLLFRKVSF